MISSAYECEFLGSMTHFSPPTVWKSFTKPRSKFFAWLVMHNKVLTTDNNRNIGGVIPTVPFACAWRRPHNTFFYDKWQLFCLFIKE
jgi:hypothetical protein